MFTSLNHLALLLLSLYALVVLAILVYYVIRIFNKRRALEREEKNNGKQK